MNPIAIWHKWNEMSGKTSINPEFWIYKYRIPELEEFIEGFEYEYLTLMITKKDIIEVNFQKFIFGSEAFGHPIEKIKQMLETGYIRVMKVNESDKITDNKMKIFYFNVSLRELLNDNKKLGNFKSDLAKIKFIISNGETAKEASDNIKKQLGVKDNGLLQNQNILQLGESGNLRYVVTSGGDELTKENLIDLPAKYEEVYVLSTAMASFANIWPKEKDTIKKVPVKNQQGEELTIIGADSEMHPVYQEVEVIESEILSKKKFYDLQRIIGISKHAIKKAWSNYLKITYPYISSIKSKYKLEGKTKSGILIKDPFQGLPKKARKSISKITKEDPFKKVKGLAFREWKPIVKPTIVQLPKSENRLVWIANVKTEDIKRIPWIEADKLVKESGYQFMSKVEAKSLSKLYFRNSKGETVKKVKIGKSFTPALGDNGVYIEKEKSPRKISSTHNTIKTIKTKVPFSKREDLIKDKYQEFVYNEETNSYSCKENGEEGLGKNVTFITEDLTKKKLDKYGNRVNPIVYKKTEIFIPVTSDSYTIEKRRVPEQKKPLRRIDKWGNIHYKKHNGVPRNPSKTALKTYEITIEKYISDNSGTAEFVYTISAPNLAKAINRGKLRILETHKDIEFRRNHGELVLPLFKAHGKEIIENGTLIPEKKDNSTKGFLRPIIVKLITPLTKTIWNKDTGKPEKMDVDEITKWVREFDKKEVSKKVKDWKHPIKNIRK
jgi:hypothetical protein